MMAFRGSTDLQPPRQVSWVVRRLDVWGDMAQRRSKRRFDNLTHAALEGSAEDVRGMIADGTHPDDREEADEPTPLMAAAARGRLDVAEMLVSAGADVNALAEDLSGELHQFPFLDDFFANARLTALTALAYAALYGQEQVYHYLAPRTAPRLRQEAEALRRARAEYPGLAPRPYLAPKKPESARQADREELLASSAAARRWVVQCGLCQKRGYKPAMPDEIDRRGTAARVRKLFPPLALKDFFCQQCRDRVAKARQRIQAERQKPRAVKARQEAEARWQKRRAEMDAANSEPPAPREPAAELWRSASGENRKGWVNAAMKELAAGRQVQVRPYGGSMRGRIESGQLVTLAPVDPASVQAGDVVLVQWKGKYLLHLVKEVSGDQFLIGNNLGKTNGWVSAQAVRGIVVAVAQQPAEQSDAADRPRE
jgi:hypothetical protein